MLFSVVIPAHNEEKDIGECLEQLVNQDCEILVVNDGSTDKTEKIARSYGVKVISFKNSHSASFARNRGAEKARGKYIVFIDADMVVPDNFIKQLEMYLPFDSLSYRVLSYKPKTIFQKAWSVYREYIDKHKNKTKHCIHCIKKELFRKVGGYNERIFYYEDSDLKERLLKLKPNHKVSNIIIRHKDAENFIDFIRQRKWQAKGILSVLREKRKVIVLKYFVPTLLLPLCYFSFLPLLAYFFYFWFKYAIKTKKLINSLLWVSLDYIGRFISLFYFVKELFKF